MIGEDIEYAKRYWTRKKHLEDLRRVMEVNIASAAQQGFFSSFVDPTGITDLDKEKLSAYRVLADQLGYEIGAYTLNKSSHTVKATIKKKQK